MEKVLGWDLESAKSLVRFVLQNKNLPKSTIFNKFARSYSRQVFSVRNYFYKLCKMLKKDKNISKMLQLKPAEVKQILGSTHFSLALKQKLLRAVLKTEGQKSVRSACLKLAGGDMELMVRYQNKYRNLIKNNKEEVLKIMDELKNKNIEIRNPFESNIVQMPKVQKTLSDADIKTLFMGLVKLIKKTAEQEVSDSLKKEAEFASNALQTTLVKLRRKELLLEELKAQNKKLKEDFCVIQNNLAKSQSQNLTTILEVQNLVNSDKMSDLKKYLQTLSTKHQTENKE